MWDVKVKVIPVIIGVNETISKSLRQYLRNITGKHEIKELLTTAKTWHCTYTVESANVKVQNKFYEENYIIGSINFKDRTAAILYTLATRFVSGS
jgi:hypothetical protein